MMVGGDDMRGGGCDEGMEGIGLRRAGKGGADTLYWKQPKIVSSSEAS